MIKIKKLLENTTTNKWKIVIQDWAISHPTMDDVVVFKNGEMFKFKSGMESNDKTLIRLGKSKINLSNLFNDDYDGFFGFGAVLYNGKKYIWEL